MENKGDWIKLNRNILNWEWYDDINATRLFIHCLLRANYDEQKWHGKIIGIGQFVTSLAHLSEETGLSIQNIRTSLNKLKLTGELTYKSTSQYSIITVNNWDRWQYNQQANQQATNKQLTTIKEIKNIRNKEINITIEEIKKTSNLLGRKIDHQAFYDYWSATDFKDKSGIPINLQQKIVSWSLKDNKNTYKPTKPASTNTGLDPVRKNQLLDELKEYAERKIKK